jgi:hypothetical protein
MYFYDEIVSRLGLVVLVIPAVGRLEAGGW